MEFAYYPGCSLHIMSSEYDVSMRKVFEKLEIKLTEVPDWFCCGASSAHMTDRLLADALPAKNLALAAQISHELAVPCAACSHRLKITNHRIKRDPQYLKLLNEKTGAEYLGDVEVKHPLEIIQQAFSDEALAAKVTKPLKDLKVASYYGCLLIRPKEIAFDDQENPQCLDHLMTTLGATPVEWGFKVECCGAGMTLAHKDTVVALVGKIIAEAIKKDADCLVVACPMCHVNLDMFQAQKKQVRQLPILYFTELMGLALGVEYKDMQIDKHITAARKVLQDLELV